MLRWLGRAYDLPARWGIRFERRLRLRFGWRTAVLLIIAPWLAIGWLLVLGWVRTASGRFSGIGWETPVGFAVVALFTYIAIVAAGLPNTRDDDAYEDRARVYASRERSVRLQAAAGGVLAAAAGLVIRAMSGG